MGKVDESQPGIVFSPFGSHLAVKVEGPYWVGGRSIACPQTGYEFSLPQTLPPLSGTLSSNLGHVLSPYAPGEEVRVPPDQWRPGGTVICPKTRRSFSLPASLPPLVAQLLEGRIGMVRSPYTGEALQLEPKDWVAGREIACAPPYLRFVLPATLPEWIGVGSVAGLPPGIVRSPYGAGPEVPVPADQWKENGLLTCPETGRRFSLPASLPLLEGTVHRGEPGKVASPFSGKSQPVSLDDWQAGGKQFCAETRRPFALPKDLEWSGCRTAPGFPALLGRVRSPFKTSPEVDVSLPVSGLRRWFGDLSGFEEALSHPRGTALPFVGVGKARRGLRSRRSGGG